MKTTRKQNLKPLLIEQSESTVLFDLLHDELNFIAIQLQMLRRDEAKSYADSDVELIGTPEGEESAHAFQHLNAVRNAIRAMLKRRQTIYSLIRKTKQQRSASSRP